jgi:SAM-dependent methyltransferase
MGDVTSFFLDLNPESSGHVVEFSEEAAEKLRQRFSENKKLTIHTHDILDESREDEFDLILAFEVLEHIEDDCGAFQRIYSALQPGGDFVMSVPAFMVKWQKVDEWAGHYRRYEKNELIDKLTACGFQIEIIWGYGFPVTKILYPLRQLYYMSSPPTDDPASKQEASKQSGINRPLRATGLAVWAARLMWPFFFMQHTVRNTNLGDGWIVLARKAR